jgi:hypothetical protein
MTAAILRPRIHPEIRPSQPKIIGAAERVAPIFREPMIETRPYYRARYYDPETGRFISGDPIQFLGGINFYAYARNGSPNVGDPSGLCDDSVDVCHAQLRGRLGAVGGQADVPHLWWWISIGNQDYTISGTGFTWDWLNGMTLNISVTPGTQSQTNPKDNLHNPDSQVLFDTRGSHGGFASPEDCPWVLAMLNRALSYPNGRIPYDLIWYNRELAWEIRTGGLSGGSVL